MTHYASTNATARALTDDDLRRVAPSIFAAEPWEGMSAKYQLIPTSSIVDGLRGEGFLPVKAMQARCRLDERRAFTKHILRFRHVDLFGLAVGDEFPEIVLVNSHDGASSYIIMAGIFRLVCSNGMIVSQGTCEELRIRHTGQHIVDNVIEGTYQVTEAVPQIMDGISQMKALELHPAEAEAFATAAATLRWDEDEHMPITPRQLLNPHRRADVGSDIWTTTNRIQENIIRGGLRGVDTKGKRTTTRPVRSIDGDVRINRALFTLAEELRKIKAS